MAQPYRVNLLFAVCCVIQSNHFVSYIIYLFIFLLIFYNIYPPLFIFLPIFYNIYPPFTRKRIMLQCFVRDVRTRLAVAISEVSGPPVFHKVERPVNPLTDTKSFMSHNYKLLCHYDVIPTFMKSIIFQLLPTIVELFQMLSIRIL